MKKNLQGHSNEGSGRSQRRRKNPLAGNKNAVSQQLNQSLRPQLDALGHLTQCLQEKDDQAFQILKKHPRLIYKLGEAVVIYYPNWGPFRIFVINEKYLLYQEDKMIFSSWCKDVVQRNLVEWHYFYEKEQKNRQDKKSGG